MRFDYGESNGLQRTLASEFHELKSGLLGLSDSPLLKAASSLLASPAGLGAVYLPSSGVRIPAALSTLPALSLPTHQYATNPGGVTAATGGGFQINLEFDSNALAAPQAFRDGITAAANILEAAFSDNITVNLAIHYQGHNGGASAGPSTGLFETYSSVRSLLIANASPGDHTFDALPNTSTIQGQHDVVVWNAELKALGLLAANNAADDGEATFSTNIAANALVGVALHELTHAMGRVPYGSPDTPFPGDTSTPDIFNLFRFTSVGNYFFDDNLPASPSYFSIDGGTTNLADYGQTSDNSDFLNTGVQGADDPFNEFYTPGSTLQDLTLVDLIQMVALGFHLNSGPDLTADSAFLNGALFGATIHNVGSASAAASTTGIYLSTDSTITTGDVLLTTISTPSLAAGTASAKKATISFTGAQAPGTYFLGALADKNGVVSEASEANNASNVVAVILGNNSGNTVNGTSSDDHIFALGGADTINPGAGNDTIDAGDGNDTISMVGSGLLNTADKIDGGANSDQLLLTGDYHAGVTFNATTLLNVETIVLGDGFNYKLTSHNATVATTQTLTVDATALGSSHRLVFNGAAETDGKFVLLGGAGADALTGGAGNDTLTGNNGADILQPGLGNDVLSGGAGNDTIKYAATDNLTAADKIDGGIGVDTLSLTGNYGAGVTFNATTLVNVEKIVLGAGFNYKFTSNDATVAAAQTLTVDASALSAANKLTFDGAAELDGKFKFLSGLGADDLTGGAMKDTYVYSSGAQSSSVNYDTIHGFNFANDRFDITGSATGIDAALSTGTLNSGGSFDTELNSVLSGHLGANHAMLFTASAGTLSGQTFLVVDLNGNAAYDAGTDLVLHLVGQTGNLATSDFI